LDVNSSWKGIWVDLPQKGAQFPARQIRKQRDLEQKNAKG
jgi:hypothetical protein